MFRSRDEVDRPSFSRLQSKCPIGRIWKRNNGRRREILRTIHFQEYKSSTSASIADKLRREINEVASYNGQTVQYVHEIRRKLFLLHEYNCQVKRVAYDYPTSDEIYKLLGRYVALEYDVLYKSEYTTTLEKEVEVKVFQIIMNFLSDPYTEDDNNSISKERKSLYDKAFKIFVSFVDVSYTSDEDKFPARILNNILNSLGLLEKSAPNARSRLDVNNPSLIRLKESLKDSDYGSDDDTVETPSESSEEEQLSSLQLTISNNSRKTADCELPDLKPKIESEDDNVIQGSSKKQDDIYSSTNVLSRLLDHNIQNCGTLLKVENENSYSPDSNNGEGSNEEDTFQNPCSSNRAQPSRKTLTFPSSNEAFGHTTTDTIQHFIVIDQDGIEEMRWNARRFPQPQQKSVVEYADIKLETAENERTNYLENVKPSSCTLKHSREKLKNRTDRNNKEFRVLDTISLTSSDSEDDFPYTPTDFENIRNRLPSLSFSTSSNCGSVSNSAVNLKSQDEQDTLSSEVLGTLHNPLIDASSSSDTQLAPETRLEDFCVESIRIEKTLSEIRDKNVANAEQVSNSYPIGKNIEQSGCVGVMTINSGKKISEILNNDELEKRKSEENEIMDCSHVTSTIVSTLVNTQPSIGIHKESNVQTGQISKCPIPKTSNSVSEKEIIQSCTNSRDACEISNFSVKTENPNLPHSGEPVSVIVLDDDDDEEVVNSITSKTLYQVNNKSSQNLDVSQKDVLVVSEEKCDTVKNMDSNNYDNNRLEETEQKETVNDSVIEALDLHKNDSSATTSNATCPEIKVEESERQLQEFIIGTIVIDDDESDNDDDCVVLDQTEISVKVVPATIISENDAYLTEGPPIGTGSKCASIVGSNILSLSHTTEKIECLVSESNPTPEKSQSLDSIVSTEVNSVQNVPMPLDTDLHKVKSLKLKNTESDLVPKSVELNDINDVLENNHNRLSNDVLLGELKDHEQILTPQMSQSKREAECEVANFVSTLSDKTETPTTELKDEREVDTIESNILEELTQKVENCHFAEQEERKTIIDESESSQRKPGEFSDFKSGSQKKPRQILAEAGPLTSKSQNINEPIIGEVAMMIPTDVSKIHDEDSISDANQKEERTQISTSIDSKGSIEQTKGKTVIDERELSQTEPVLVGDLHSENTIIDEGELTTQIEVSSISDESISIEHRKEKKVQIVKDVNLTEAVLETKATIVIDNSELSQIKPSEMSNLSDESHQDPRQLQKEDCPIVQIVRDVNLTEAVVETKATIVIDNSELSQIKPSEMSNLSDESHQEPRQLQKEDCPIELKILETSERIVDEVQLTLQTEVSRTLDKDFNSVKKQNDEPIPTTNVNSELANLEKAVAVIKEKELWPQTKPVEISDLDSESHEKTGEILKEDDFPKSKSDKTIPKTINKDALAIQTEICRIHDVDLISDETKKDESVQIMDNVNSTDSVSQETTQVIDEKELPQTKPANISEFDRSQEKQGQIGKKICLLESKNQRIHVTIIKGGLVVLDSASSEEPKEILEEVLLKSQKPSKIINDEAEFKIQIENSRVDRVDYTLVERQGDTKVPSQVEIISEKNHSASETESAEVDELPINDLEEGKMPEVTVSKNSINLQIKSTNMINLDASAEPERFPKSVSPNKDEYQHSCESKLNVSECQLKLSSPSLKTDTVLYNLHPEVFEEDISEVNPSEMIEKNKLNPMFLESDNFDLPTGEPTKELTEIVSFTSESFIQNHYEGVSDYVSIGESKVQEKSESFTIESKCVGISDLSNSTESGKNYLPSESQKQFEIIADDLKSKPVVQSENENINDDAILVEKSPRKNEKTCLSDLVSPIEIQNSSDVGPILNKKLIIKIDSGTKKLVDDHIQFSMHQPTQMNSTICPVGQSNSIENGKQGISPICGEIDISVFTPSTRSLNQKASEKNSNLSPETFSSAPYFGDDTRCPTSTNRKNKNILEARIKRSSRKTSKPMTDEVSRSCQLHEINQVVAEGRKQLAAKDLLVSITSVKSTESKNTNHQHSSCDCVKYCSETEEKTFEPQNTYLKNLQNSPNGEKYATDDVERDVTTDLNDHIGKFNSTITTDNVRNIEGVTLTNRKITTIRKYMEKNVNHERHTQSINSNIILNSVAPLGKEQATSIQNCEDTSNGNIATSEIYKIYEQEMCDNYNQSVEKRIATCSASTKVNFTEEPCGTKIITTKNINEIETTKASEKELSPDCRTLKHDVLQDDFDSPTNMLPSAEKLEMIVVKGKPFNSESLIASTIESTKSKSQIISGIEPISPKEPEIKSPVSHNLVGNINKAIMMTGQSSVRRPQRNISNQFLTSPTTLGKTCFKNDLNPTLINSSIAKLENKEDRVSRLTLKFLADPKNQVENTLHSSSPEKLHLHPKNDPRLISSFDMSVSSHTSNIIDSPFVFPPHCNAEYLSGKPECPKEKLDMLATVAAIQIPMKVEGTQDEKIHPRSLRDRGKSTALQTGGYQMKNAPFSPVCISIPENKNDETTNDLLCQIENLRSQPLVKGSIADSNYHAFTLSTRPSSFHEETVNSTAMSKNCPSVRRRGRKTEVVPLKKSDKQNKSQKGQHAKKKIKEKYSEQQMPIPALTSPAKRNTKCKKKNKMNYNDSDVPLVIDTFDSDDSVPLLTRIKNNETPYTKIKRGKKYCMKRNSKGTNRNNDKNSRGKISSRISCREKANKEKKEESKNTEDSNMFVRELDLASCTPKLELNTISPQKFPPDIDGDQKKKIVHFKKLILANQSKLISQVVDHSSSATIHDCASNIHEKSDENINVQSDICNDYSVISPTQSLPPLSVPNHNISSTTTPDLGTVLGQYEDIEYAPMLTIGHVEVEITDQEFDSQKCINDYSNASMEKIDNSSCITAHSEETGVIKHAEVDTPVLEGNKLSKSCNSPLSTTNTMKIPEVDSDSQNKTELDQHVNLSDTCPSIDQPTPVDINKCSKDSYTNSNTEAESTSHISDNKSNEIFEQLVNDMNSASIIDISKSEVPLKRASEESTASVGFSRIKISENPNKMKDSVIETNYRNTESKQKLDSPNLCNEIQDARDVLINETEIDVNTLSISSKHPDKFEKKGDVENEQNVSRKVEPYSQNEINTDECPQHEYANKILNPTMPAAIERSIRDLSTLKKTQKTEKKLEKDRDAPKNGSQQIRNISEAPIGRNKNTRKSIHDNNKCLNVKARQPNTMDETDYSRRKSNIITTNGLDIFDFNEKEISPVHKFERPSQAIEFNSHENKTNDSNKCDSSMKKNHQCSRNNRNISKKESNEELNSRNQHHCKRSGSGKLKSRDSDHSHSRERKIEEDTPKKRKKSDCQEIDVRSKYTSDHERKSKMSKSSNDISSHNLSKLHSDSKTPNSSKSCTQKTLSSQHLRERKTSRNQMHIDNELEMRKKNKKSEDHKGKQSLLDQTASEPKQRKHSNRKLKRTLSSAPPSRKENNSASNKKQYSPKPENSEIDLKQSELSVGSENSLNSTNRRIGDKRVHQEEKNKLHKGPMKVSSTEFLTDPKDNKKVDASIPKFTKRDVSEILNSKERASTDNKVIVPSKLKKLDQKPVSKPEHHEKERIMNEEIGKSLFQSKKEDIPALEKEKKSPKSKKPKRQLEQCKLDCATVSLNENTELTKSEINKQNKENKTDMKVQSRVKCKISKNEQVIVDAQAANENSNQTVISMSTSIESTSLCRGESSASESQNSERNKLIRETAPVKTTREFIECNDEQTQSQLHPAKKAKLHEIQNGISQFPVGLEQSGKRQENVDANTSSNFIEIVSLPSASTLGDTTSVDEKIEASKLKELEGNLEHDVSNDSMPFNASKCDRNEKHQHVVQVHPVDEAEQSCEEKFKCSEESQFKQNVENIRDSKTVNHNLLKRPSADEEVVAKKRDELNYNGITKTDKQEEQIVPLPNRTSCEEQTQPSSETEEKQKDIIEVHMSSEEITSTFNYANVPTSENIKLTEHSCEIDNEKSSQFEINDAKMQQFELMNSSSTKLDSNHYNTSEIQLSRRKSEDTEILEPLLTSDEVSSFTAFEELVEYETNEHVEEQKLDVLVHSVVQIRSNEKDDLKSQLSPQPKIDNASEQTDKVQTKICNFSETSISLGKRDSNTSSDEIVTNLTTVEEIEHNSRTVIEKLIADKTTEHYKIELQIRPMDLQNNSVINGKQTNDIEKQFPLPKRNEKVEDSVVAMTQSYNFDDVNSSVNSKGGTSNENIVPKIEKIEAEMKKLDTARNEENNVELLHKLKVAVTHGEQTDLKSLVDAKNESPKETACVQTIDTSTSSSIHCLSVSDENKLPSELKKVDYTKVRCGTLVGKLATSSAQGYNENNEQSVHLKTNAKLHDEEEKTPGVKKMGPSLETRVERTEDGITAFNKELASNMYVDFEQKIERCEHACETLDAETSNSRDNITDENEPQSIQKLGQHLQEPLRLPSSENSEVGQLQLDEKQHEEGDGVKDNEENLYSLLESEVDQGQVASKQKKIESRISSDHGAAETMVNLSQELSTKKIAMIHHDSQKVSIHTNDEKKEPNTIKNELSFSIEKMLQPDEKTRKSGSNVNEINTNIKGKTSRSPLYQKSESNTKIINGKIVSVTERSHRKGDTPTGSNIQTHINSELTARKLGTEKVQNHLSPANPSMDGGQANEKYFDGLKMHSNNRDNPESSQGLPQHKHSSSQIKNGKLSVHAKLKSADSNLGKSTSFNKGLSTSHKNNSKVIVEKVFSYDYCTAETPIKSQANCSNIHIFGARTEIIPCNFGVYGPYPPFYGMKNVNSSGHSRSKTSRIPTNLNIATTDISQIVTQSIPKAKGKTLKQVFPDKSIHKLGTKLETNIGAAGKSSVQHVENEIEIVQIDSEVENINRSGSQISHGHTQVLSNIDKQGNNTNRGKKRSLEIKEPSSVQGGLKTRKLDEKSPYQSGSHSNPGTSKEVSVSGTREEIGREKNTSAKILDDTRKSKRKHLPKKIQIVEQHQISSSRIEENSHNILGEATPRSRETRKSIECIVSCLKSSGYKGTSSECRSDLKELNTIEQQFIIGVKDSTLKHVDLKTESLIPEEAKPGEPIEEKVNSAEKETTPAISDSRGEKRANSTSINLETKNGNRFLGHNNLSGSEQSTKQNSLESPNLKQENEPDSKFKQTGLMKMDVELPILEVNAPFSILHENPTIVNQVDEKQLTTSAEAGKVPPLEEVILRSTSCQETELQFSKHTQLRNQIKYSDHSLLGSEQLSTNNLALSSLNQDLKHDNKSYSNNASTTPKRATSSIILEPEESWNSSNDKFVTEKQFCNNQLTPLSDIAKVSLFREEISSCPLGQESDSKDPEPKSMTCQYGEQYQSKTSAFSEESKYSEPSLSDPEQISVNNLLLTSASQDPKDENKTNLNYNEVNTALEQRKSLILEPKVTLNTLGEEFEIGEQFPENRPLGGVEVSPTKKENCSSSLCQKSEVQEPGQSLAQCNETHNSKTSELIDQSKNLEHSLLDMLSQSPSQNLKHKKRPDSTLNECITTLKKEVQPLKLEASLNTLNETKQIDEQFSDNQSLPLTEAGKFSPTEDILSSSLCQENKLQVPKHNHQYAEENRSKISVLEKNIYSGLPNSSPDTTNLQTNTPCNIVDTAQKEMLLFAKLGEQFPNIYGNETISQLYQTVLMTKLQSGGNQLIAQQITSDTTSFSQISCSLLGNSSGGNAQFVQESNSAVSFILQPNSSSCQPGITLDGQTKTLLMTKLQSSSNQLIAQQINTDTTTGTQINCSALSNSSGVDNAVSLTLQPNPSLCQPGISLDSQTNFLQNISTRQEAQVPTQTVDSLFDGIPDANYLFDFDFSTINSETKNNNGGIQYADDLSVYSVSQLQLFLDNPEVFRLLGGCDLARLDDTILDITRMFRERTSTVYITDSNANTKIKNQCNANMSNTNTCVPNAGTSYSHMNAIITATNTSEANTKNLNMNGADAKGLNSNDSNRNDKNTDDANADHVITVGDCMSSTEIDKQLENFIVVEDGTMDPMMGGQENRKPQECSEPLQDSLGSDISFDDEYMENYALLLQCGDDSIQSETNMQTSDNVFDLNNQCEPIPDPKNSNNEGNMAVPVFLDLNITSENGTEQLIPDISLNLNKNFNICSTSPSNALTHSNHVHQDSQEECSLKSDILQTPEIVLPFEQDFMHNYSARLPSDNDIFNNLQQISEANDVENSQTHSYVPPDHEIFNEQENLSMILPELNNILNQEKNDLISQISEIMSDTKIPETSVAANSNITSSISVSENIVSESEQSSKNHRTLRSSNSSQPLGADKVFETANQDIHKKTNVELDRPRKTVMKEVKNKTSNKSPKNISQIDLQETVKSLKTPGRSSPRIQKIPASRYSPPKKPTSPDNIQPKKIDAVAEPLKQSLSVSVSQPLDTPEPNKTSTTSANKTNTLDMPDIFELSENNSCQNVSPSKPPLNETELETVEPQLKITLSSDKPHQASNDFVPSLEQGHFNMYDIAKSKKRNAARDTNYSQFFDNDPSSVSKSKKRKAVNKTDSTTDAEEVGSQDLPSPNPKTKIQDCPDVGVESKSNRSKKQKVSSLSSRDTVTPAVSDMDAEFDRLKKTVGPIKSPMRSANSELQKDTDLSRTDRILRSAHEGILPKDHHHIEVEKGASYHHSRSPHSKNKKKTELTRTAECARTDRILRSAYEGSSFSRDQPIASSTQNRYDDRGRRGEHKQYSESYRRSTFEDNSRSYAPYRPSTYTPSSHYRQDSHNWPTRSEGRRRHGWHGRDPYKSQAQSEDRRRSERYYTRDFYRPDSDRPDTSRVDRGQSANRQQQNAKSDKGEYDWFTKIDELFPLTTNVFQRTGH